MITDPETSYNFHSVLETADAILASKTGAKHFSKPGIYFLIRQNEIVYIGRGNHVWHRLTSHIPGENYNFDNYSVIECDSIRSSEILEHTYIDRFNPVYNRTPGNGKGTTPYIILRAAQRSKLQTHTE